ncbi:ABC transporter permease [Oceanicella actignis]|uniref:Histidine transport system permease protein/arginine/ornithine transport system permease protein n=1 Tax=Oceanicella actignis TaxID=1189325 RepID=A0A1M7TV44_9RHOB|nr:ABC transporter permease subunit [Oceanicella actignis]TYO90479.1 amino acid ABC transporter membrane protein 1 (PAAT family) [Oceanicella actignis]SES79175.1 amino acid ABC transporter membrane protein 1, PAAT family [Oceanicella actignis]SHN74493.1 histidine transport system permease protein/arginine/ornithine transport system permease protein [Oceanicella actignis]
MDALIAYAPLLGRGALVTIALALASMALATTLGALGAAAKLAGGAVARALAAAYTTLIRGVPDLVLILLVYFGGQRLANDIGGALGWDYVEISKFWAGVLSIGVIYGGYLTETFRGAYLTVPRGQAEAAKALGMRPLATLWTVTGPQMARFALPGYGNVWQVLVKSTAVVSVIGLDDLVGLADKAAKSTREPFTFFLAVILVYLAITSVSNALLARAEARLNLGQGR